MVSNLSNATTLGARNKQNLRCSWGKAAIM